MISIRRWNFWSEWSVVSTEAPLLVHYLVQNSVILIDKIIVSKYNIDINQDHNATLRAIKCRLSQSKLQA
jgi:hypothetical protein